MEDENADRVYVPGTNGSPPDRDVEPFWPPEELSAPVHGGRPVPHEASPAFPLPSPPAPPHPGDPGLYRPMDRPAPAPPAYQPPVPPAPTSAPAPRLPVQPPGPDSTGRPWSQAAPAPAHFSASASVSSGAASGVVPGPPATGPFHTCRHRVVGAFPAVGR